MIHGDPPDSGVGGASAWRTDGRLVGALIAQILTQVLGVGGTGQERSGGEDSQQKEGCFLVVHPGIVGREMGHHNGN